MTISLPEKRVDFRLQIPARVIREIIDAAGSHLFDYGMLREMCGGDVPVFDVLQILLDKNYNVVFAQRSPHKIGPFLFPRFVVGISAKDPV